MEFKIQNSPKSPNFMKTLFSLQMEGQWSAWATKKDSYTAISRNMGTWSK